MNWRSFTIMALLGAAYLPSCKKNSNAELNSVASEPERLIYTLAEADTFEMKDVRFGAYWQLGKQRFLDRSMGNFTRSKESTSEYSSDLTEDTKLQVNCTAGQACQVTAKIYDYKSKTLFKNCEGQIPKLPSSPLEYVVIPCKKNKVATSLSHLVLAAPRSNGVLAPKPLTAFELMRIGPLDDFHKWKATVVDVKNPIQFHVQSELLKNANFMRAFREAVKYWNNAAGKTLIDDIMLEASQLSFEPFQSQVSMLPSQDNPTIARGSNLSDPTTGEILSIKVGIFRIQENYADLYHTVVHELGHGLGLMHNFAASHDPLGKEFGGATSVMDYFDEGFEIKSLLPYDRAIMRYLYQGEKPGQAFLHCNDFQIAVILECGKYRYPFPLDIVSKGLEKLIDKNLPDRQIILNEEVEMLADFTAEDLDVLEKRDRVALREFQSYFNEILLSAMKYVWYDKTLSQERREALKALIYNYIDALIATETAQNNPLKMRQLKVYRSFVERSPFTSMNP